MENAFRRLCLEQLNKRTLVAVSLFCCFVLVFTFNDKLVHNDAYVDVPGLQYKSDWLLEYWVNYFFMFELAILATTAICLSKWFFVFTELFVVFTTQDIMFFLWTGTFPVGDWTWMWQYQVFGTWTTMLQFLVSSLLFAALGFYGLFWVRRNGFFK